MKGRRGKIKCEKALSKKEASPAQGDRDRGQVKIKWPGPPVIKRWRVAIKHPEL